MDSAASSRAKASPDAPTADGPTTEDATRADEAGGDETTRDEATRDEATDGTVPASTDDGDDDGDDGDDVGVPPPLSAATAPDRPIPDEVPEPGDPARYFTRQISELEYHARVLAGAADPDQPLLERVRFCAFFTTLTDEFFRVRVAGLKEKAEASGLRMSRGMTAVDRDIAALQARFRELAGEQRRIWVDDLRPRLDDAGIVVTEWAALDDDQRASLSEVFDERIFPVLTPLAVGPAHPFPFISDLSLSLGVRMDPSDGGPDFARVKLPPLLDRYLVVAQDATSTTLVRVEEVVGAHIDRLFPGRTVIDWHLFRVTRNAGYAVQGVDVEDLLETVAAEVKERRFGRAVRLEVTESMPADVRLMIQDHLDLDDGEVVVSPGPIDLGAVGQLYDLDRPDLKRASWRPLDLPEFRGSKDIFAILRDRDLLVHHPYESFATSTQKFIEMAAADPRVLAIKQTLYRTSGDSPVVHAMIRAAAEGKQAVVLVELKARFDEEANIGWARKLEETGVHVVYGFVELKTHTKTALVVREDEDGHIRRYGHVATGNYNPKTARFYEDIGMFTADPVLTADLGQLFNMLTGHSRNLRPDKLLIAPTTLRPRLVELIESQAHPDGRIFFKANHLAHHQIIDALYAASQAGAAIDLVLRTTCCLRPGIPGLSDNIRVKSVVGPFLEHSRIYRFGHDPEPGAYLIGSADLMSRNLDNRVEAVAPVDQADLRARLDTIVEQVLADEALSWELHPSGRWTKLPGDHNLQEELAAAAIARSRG
jgi:polyphosphate kinase